MLIPLRFPSLLAALFMLLCVTAAPAADFGTRAIQLKGGSYETRELFNPSKTIKRRIEKGDILMASFAVPPALYKSKEKHETWTFRVKARLGWRHSREIFSQVLAPASDKKDRGWHDVNLSLDEFAGRKISISFSCERRDLEGRPAGDPEALWGGLRFGNFRRKTGDLNVIVVSLDNVRADHLSLYGYDRPTSPNLEKVASEGVWFEEAIAQTPWTTPSHMSIFTGLRPSEHGLFDPGADQELSADIPLMAELLSSKGYLSAAFTGGAEMSAKSGFWRGFARYREFGRPKRGDGRWVAQSAGEFLNQHRDDKFFMFIHTYEAQTPHRHRSLAARDRKPSSDEVYDSGIVYVDRLIGLLWNRLEELELTENTLLVVLSDHGEQGKDRRSNSGGHSIYDKMLRVPLVFRLGDRLAPRRVSGFQAQHIDVLPTILDYAGIGSGSLRLPGRSLRPFLEGAEAIEPAASRGEGAQHGGREATPILQAGLSYFGKKAIQLKNEKPPALQTGPVFAKNALEQDVKPDDVLFFSYGVTTNAPARSKGITFRVSALTRRGRKTLFERALLPGKRKGDRGWHHARIDLAPVAGQKTKIVFEAKAGGAWMAAAPAAKQGALWAGVRVGSRRKNEPNIVLVSFDTLRADRISATGYHRPTTPNIDALIKEGYWFTEAVSQAPWTKPAHMSLFTGLYPSAHGQNELKEIDGNQVELPETIPTLTEVLRDKGYLTQAYTGSGYVSARYGFARGFDRYWENIATKKADADAIFESGIDFIRENHDRKFFLFLHTFEVHRPYTRSVFLEGSRKKKDPETLNALYDSGVRYADEQFGRFMAALKELKLDKSTIVVVLSDHGEELAQRGLWAEHGHSLYDDQIRIPLVFWHPGSIVHGAAPHQAQLIDVMPTIADLLGIDLPKPVQGTSLASMLKGGVVPAESTAFSEMVEFGGNDRDLKSIRYVGTEKLKYIYSPSAANEAPTAYLFFPPSAKHPKNRYWINVVMRAKGREFYDLSADPGETRNLASANDPRIKPLQEKLDSYFRSVRGRSVIRLPQGRPPADDALNAELMEKLRSLGY